MECQNDRSPVCEYHGGIDVYKRQEQIYEMMAMAKVDAVCRKIPDAATQAKVQKFLGRAVEEEEA